MKEKWHQISAAISLLLTDLLGARLSKTGLVTTFNERLSDGFPPLRLTDLEMQRQLDYFLR